MTQAAKYVLVATSIVTGISLPASLAPVIAQQGNINSQGITRTVLGTFEFPPGYQTIISIGQIPANTCFERHTHFGLENYYVLEGEGVLMIPGKSDQHVKAGDAGQIPPGVPHSGCTMASAEKVLVTFVVEKGKPFAPPAP
jgi:quercetin dioxygenase-like cupin family protein